MLGLDLPVQPVRRQKVYIAPKPQIPQDAPLVIDVARDAYWRPETGGAFIAWDQASLLPHDVVWSITRARSRTGRGSLFVGTQDGLCEIPPTGSLRVLREKDGLPGNLVSALAAGADGSFWVGSRPGGVALMGAGPPRRYGAEGLDPKDFHVLALRVSSGGDVWAGTTGGGLARFSGGRFSRIGVADGLSSITKLVAGHFTDRLRSRKPLVVTAYAITAAATGARARICFRCSRGLHRARYALQRTPAVRK
jgi:hypothetical protein